MLKFPDTEATAIKDSPQFKHPPLVKRFSTFYCKINT